MALEVRAPQVGEQVVDPSGRVLAEFAILLQQLARALQSEQGSSVDLAAAVTALGNDLALANTNISTLDSEIAALDGDVVALGGDVVALGGRVSALEGATFAAPAYTVSGAPSAATAGAGAIIHVTNEAGGAVLAFSDGTDWLRVTDRAVIS